MTRSKLCAAALAALVPGLVFGVDLGGGGISGGGVPPAGSNTGDVTLATVGSTPANAGASLSNQVLTLQPADATHAGVVSTTTQTIAGAKTFTGNVVGTDFYVLGRLVGENTSGLLKLVSDNSSGLITPAFIFDTAAAPLAFEADLFSWRNAGAAIMTLGTDGTLASTGNVNAGGYMSASTFYGLASSTATVSGQNSGNSVSVVSDNSGGALTSGAKIHSFRSSGAEVAYISYSGDAVLAGGITIGSGSYISKTIRVSGTIDVASVAAGVCVDTAITVTGAVANAECAVGAPVAVEADLEFQCFVSAADTVKLRTCNPHAVSAIDPASATWAVRVLNP